MFSLFDSLANEIFQILKGSGRALTLYTYEGKLTYEPSKARRMFAEPDRLMITILDQGRESSVKMYLSKQTKLQNVMNLVQSLRNSATRHNTIFNVRKYNKQLSPRDFAYQAYVGESCLIEKPHIYEMKTDNCSSHTLNRTRICDLFMSYKNTNDVNESLRFLEIPHHIFKQFCAEHQKLIETNPYRAAQLFSNTKDRNAMGVKESMKTYTKRSSIHVGPDTSIIVEHKDTITEGRTERDIIKIIIEHNGRKSTFPNTCVSGALALGRHLSEGGKVNSPLGKHIVRLSETVSKLHGLGSYIQSHDKLTTRARAYLPKIVETVRKAQTELKLMRHAPKWDKVLENAKSLPAGILQESNTSDVVKNLTRLFKLDENHTLVTTLPLLVGVLRAPFTPVMEKDGNDDDDGDLAPRQAMSMREMAQKVLSDDFGVSGHKQQLDKIQDERRENIVRDRVHGFRSLMNLVNRQKDMYALNETSADEAYGFHVGWLSNMVADDNLAIALQSLTFKVDQKREKLTKNEKLLILRLYQRFMNVAYPQYKKLAAGFEKRAKEVGVVDKDARELFDWFDQFDPETLLSEEGPRFEISVPRSLVSRVDRIDVEELPSDEWKPENHVSGFLDHLEQDEFSYAGVSQVKTLVNDYDLEVRIVEEDPSQTIRIWSPVGNPEVVVAYAITTNGSTTYFIHDDVDELLMADGHEDFDDEWHGPDSEDYTDVGVSDDDPKFMARENADSSTLKKKLTGCTI